MKLSHAYCTYIRHALDRIGLLEATLADVEYDISKMEKTQKRMEADIERIRAELENHRGKGKDV